MQIQTTRATECLSRRCSMKTVSKTNSPEGVLLRPGVRARHERLPLVDGARGPPGMRRPEGAGEGRGRNVRNTRSRTGNTLVGIYEPVIPKIALQYALSARHTVIRFNSYSFINNFRLPKNKHQTSFMELQRARCPMTNDSMINET